LRDGEIAPKIKPMSAQNQSFRINSPALLPGWVRVVLIGRNWKLTLARLAVFVVACLVFFKFVLLPIRVEGISMLPTCRNGSVKFVNRLAYLWHPPRRGDVVGIRLSPPGLMPPSIMYLKRIIGLPGETVAFAHGRVLIDGRKLDEPYEKYECNWNQPPVKLGPYEYYVVGDNRSMPPEDHVHGKVERDHIVGKAIL
jgi:signal peptidase I